MNKNIEVLEEIIDLLEGEKRKFYDLVNQNDFRIEEINSYLRELSKREDDDFKVFSPRNVENMHREQIEADASEREKYEKENAEYHKKIESLKGLIDKVNVVIGNLQIEAEKRQAGEYGENSGNNLSDNPIKSEKNNEVAGKENFGNNNTEQSYLNNNKNFAENNTDRIDIENNAEENSETGGDEKKNTDLDIVINERKQNIDIKNFTDEDNIERQHIAHQILNCVSFITPDAERAKIELTALARKIGEH